MSGPGSVPASTPDQVKQADASGIPLPQQYGFSPNANMPSDPDNKAWVAKLNEILAAKTARQQTVDLLANTPGRSATILADPNKKGLL